MPIGWTSAAPVDSRGARAIASSSSLTNASRAPRARSRCKRGREQARAAQRVDVAAVRDREQRHARRGSAASADGASQCAIDESQRARAARDRGGEPRGERGRGASQRARRARARRARRRR